MEKLSVKLDYLIDEVADLSDITKAASSFESLVRTQKTLITLEREALNIDSAPPNTEDGLASLIASINGASLPII